MRAWQVHELGEATDVLHLEGIDVPEPDPGEVRIQVDACGLNFPDLLLCKGEYQVKPPLPFTPGMEVAGTITAIGDGVDLSVGDRVLGSPPLPRGGLMEQTILPAAQALPVPDEVTADQAAASYITYQTGYVGLHDRVALQPGETLLVNAGAGGVGSAAIQLGKAAGAKVIATAGGPERTKLCLELGADVAIDYSTGDLAAQVKEANGGRGVDVVFDPVGGDVFDASTKCIGYNGRLLVVGFASGRIPSVKAGHVLVKNYSVVGLHWGHMIGQQPGLQQRTHEILMQLLADGVISPLIDSVIGLDSVPDALRRLGSRQVTGKVLVHPSE